MTVDIAVPDFYVGIFKPYNFPIEIIHVSLTVEVAFVKNVNFDLFFSQIRLPGKILFIFRDNL